MFIPSDNKLIRSNRLKLAKVKGNHTKLQWKYNEDVFQ